jgi:hypothetical protein
MSTIPFLLSPATAAPSNSAKAVENHMSFFSKLVAEEHTFAAWAEKELVALEQKAPKIEEIIDTTLKYVGPALQIGLTAIGDLPAAAATGLIIAEAHKDLIAASALVTDFGPTPTAASMFAAVKTNLSAILTTIKVTNPQTVATVTKSINEVGALATSVSAAASAIAAVVTPVTA